MFKVTLLFALLGFACSLRLTSSTFELFVQQYGRVYETEVEHNLRYWTFYKNMAKWELLNKLELGTATYGMNKFADLTTEEFRSMYLVDITDKDMFYVNMLPKAEEMDVSASPSTVDWRKKNAVTGVKNQGQCGSCWAFSTTGNIEGLWSIKTGKLISLSEQELLDCDVVDQACNGGLPFQAYAEIMRLGGLMTEAAYPYTAEKQRCKFDKSEVVATVSGRTHISTDERQMASFIAEYGPVSIGINAEAMQSYTGGISHPLSFMCNPSELDHGVLITGYGTASNTPYWEIKNSWGADWGEDGYYRAYRGAGVCGLNRMVTSAKV